MAQHSIHNERGASLVEYALLVALISVVSIGAIRTLGTSASDSIDSAAVAVGISEPGSGADPTPGGGDNGGGNNGGGDNSGGGNNGGGSGGGDNGGGSGGGDTGGGGTTTTTTTPPPTTTVPPAPKSGDAKFSNHRSQNDSGGTWKASADIKLVGADGQSLPGTIQVRVRIVEHHEIPFRGSHEEVKFRTITLVDGEGQISDGQLKKRALFQEGITSISYEIVDVQSDDGGELDWSAPGPLRILAP